MSVTASVVGVTVEPNRTRSTRSLSPASTRRVLLSGSFSASAISIVFRYSTRLLLLQRMSSQRGVSYKTLTRDMLKWLRVVQLSGQSSLSLCTRRIVIQPERVLIQSNMLQTYPRRHHKYSFGQQLFRRRPFCASLSESAEAGEAKS